MKIVQLLLLIILCTSCADYRVFYDPLSAKNKKSEDKVLEALRKQQRQDFKIIGKRSNKLLENNEGYKDYDPNILKTTYKEMVASILIANIPENIDDEKLDPKQTIFVRLYFSSKNLRPVEVYFGTHIMNLFSVFPKKNIENIENELKKRVIAEKNYEAFGESEVERQLASTNYVQHIAAFRAKELAQVKQGKLAFDKITYL
ncbi:MULTISPECIES: hypothetical protein [Sphingobacterium]|uniref:hypothetical protein n=1 Tax=Sphingobacterium TaxID=28453 RepID=UPI0013DA0E63|nr:MULTISPECIES: hypothetical protein [unclassified Sphingobacterium]